MIVKRFWSSNVLITHDDGQFVGYPDYAALETRVKELEAERDRLASQLKLFADAGWSIENIAGTVMPVQLCHCERCEEKRHARN